MGRTRTQATETCKCNAHEHEDNDQGEVTMTHPHVENEMQGFTVAMLRSKAKIGRMLKERAHGNARGAKVNAVMGDAFKNCGDAHAWVMGTMKKGKGRRAC